MALALGGAAAVAAHCGNEERLSAKVAEETDGAFEDDGDVGDAAAAGGQGDRLARLDALAEVEFCQSGTDGGGNVVETRAGERLSNTEHAG